MVNFSKFTLNKNRDRICNLLSFCQVDKDLPMQKIY